MYEVTAGTARAGVIFSDGSIGNDGANETIGDVSRATIGRGATIGRAISVTIGAMAMGATIVDEGATRDARANCGTCEVLEAIAAKADNVR